MRTLRVYQITGFVRNPTLLTHVPILIRCLALWAGALYQSIRQKQRTRRTIHLNNGFFVYRLGLSSRLKKLLAADTIGLTMGLPIIIKLNMIPFKIRTVFVIYCLNIVFRGNPLFLSTKHNWCSMRIVRTHIMTGSAHAALKSNKNIRLNVFHHMPQMQRAIRIRQRTGNQHCVFHYLFSIHHARQLGN